MPGGRPCGFAMQDPASILTRSTGLVLQVWGMFGDTYMFAAVLDASPVVKSELGSTLIVLWTYTLVFELFGTHHAATPL